MQNITTIKLEKQTKARLVRLKEHERETFDQVIKKILYVLNQIRKDPVSGNKLLGRIDKNIKIKQAYFKESKTLKTKESEEENGK